MGRLALNRDEKTGLMSSLEMNGKKYLFGYEGRPRVETVGGQNLVGGVELSLHQITYPPEMGGKKETYDFAVTEKMLPELKITDTQGKERMIVWGLDGRMLQDGEWTYTIKPQSDPNARFASIERKNAEGKSEFWNKDEAKGEEIAQSLDGTKTIRTWFTSGMLAGKNRKEITTQNNRIINQNSWSYDEKGEITKIIQKQDIDGQQFTELINNSGVVKRTIFKNGRISFRNVNFNGKELEIYYADGAQVRIYSTKEKKWLINSNELISILEKTKDKKS